MTSSSAGLDAGAPVDAGPCPGGGLYCNGACCVGTTGCHFGQCIEESGACSTSDDCSGDAYCDLGACLAYGTPAGHSTNQACTRFIDIEAVVPSEKCRWTGPADGGPWPGFHQVMSTPVVVDFDMDSEPETLSPSIVFASFSTALRYTGRGVLRVIKGKNCADQWSSEDPEDSISAPASPAVGDITGDGRPEIVAGRQRPMPDAGVIGGTIAFQFNEQTLGFDRMWTSAHCDPQGNRTPDTTGGSNRWSGPSLYDLDDDGIAEILYGLTVYGADGCIIDDSLGWPAYSVGYVPVVADVDEDGVPEAVAGNGIYEWDAVQRQWVAETYFTVGTLTRGQVAVADFGIFPLASHGGGDRAEVVVVSSTTVRVQTIEGTVIFGPIAIPGGGTGGLPTIADFDGDGRVEFASAGGDQYVVFDLDCLPTGDPTRCPSGRTDGVLWAQPSKDHSSNVTGSSVFDFDADGNAEVVYADECFLRVYDGTTGTVLYSAARSSGTTYENPVIVDVDGDFHAEIVSSVNDYGGTYGCPATDPLYPSESSAARHGILVLQDEQDRWAASRPVWNQHAYSVTNVGDRGQIPRTSEVAINWRQPGLNNFRQNVQGGLESTGVADLTAQGSPVETYARCLAGQIRVRANICNRGLLPVGSGTIVSMRLGAADGDEICRATLATTLVNGGCAGVMCEGPFSGTNGSDIYVIVDPDGAQSECLEGNNTGVLRNIQCTD